MTDRNDPKKVRCADCGKPPATGKLNRRGRCGACGMDALVFAMTVNMLAVTLTRKQRNEVRRLLAKYQPDRTPAAAQRRVDDAVAQRQAGLAAPRRVPGRHAKAAP